MSKTFGFYKLTTHRLNVFLLVNTITLLYFTLTHALMNFQLCFAVCCLQSLRNDCDIALTNSPCFDDTAWLVTTPDLSSTLINNGRFRPYSSRAGDKVLVKRLWGWLAEATGAIVHGENLTVVWKWRRATLVSVSVMEGDTNMTVMESDTNATVWLMGTIVCKRWRVTH